MKSLAEAEHNGWMAQRRRNGWRYGETRDDARKLHPTMLPYAQLPEREKGKDRKNVRHYADFAARAGYRISSRSSKNRSALPAAAALTHSATLFTIDRED